MKWTTAMKFPFCGIFWVTEIFQSWIKIEDMEERVTRNAHVCKRVPERSRCQLRIRRISNLKSLIADFKILILAHFRQVRSIFCQFSSWKNRFYFLNNKAVALWHHKLDSVVYFRRDLGNGAVVNRARRAEGQIRTRLFGFAYFFKTLDRTKRITSRLGFSSGCSLYVGS